MDLQGMTGGMSDGITLPPQYDFETLKSKYRNFHLPEATVALGGEVLRNKSGSPLRITELHIELCSGFEASIARVKITNVYDSRTGRFSADKLGKQFALGSAMAVGMGYSGRQETIFVGFVAGLTFGFDGITAYAEVVGMDIKGLMMAGNYAYQLNADNYADAVREILRKTAYEQLRSSGGIGDIRVSDTPDVDPAVLAAMKATESAQQMATQAQRAAQLAEMAANASGTADALQKAKALREKAMQAVDAVKSAREAFESVKTTVSKMKDAVEDATKLMASAPAQPVPVPIPPGPVSEWGVEMSGESDYEFVVKAAKKFNFEFFVDCGVVYFRKAKENPDPLLELTSDNGLLDFNIEYSITGIVGAVEARAMDPGVGKMLSAKSKLENDISDTKTAKGLVGGGRRVLIDPTIGSQEVADARVASMLEEMSYRLGKLEASCVGLPELRPGRFVRIAQMGAPADNDFYITNVTHCYESETGYRTIITGKADRVKGGNGLGAL